MKMIANMGTVSDIVRQEAMEMAIRERTARRGTVTEKTLWPVKRPQRRKKPNHLMRKSLVRRRRG